MRFPGYPEDTPKVFVHEFEHVYGKEFVTYLEKDGTVTVDWFIEESQLPTVQAVVTASASASAKYDNSKVRQIMINVASDILIDILMANPTESDTEILGQWIKALKEKLAEETGK